MTNFGDKVTFIWSVADLLRDAFKRSKYPDVILPFTVLRRIDCVLQPTKPKVLDVHGKLKGKLENLGRVLRVFTKTVKGLFYHLTKYPLPKDSFAYCNFLDIILAEWPKDVVKDIEEVVLPVLVPQTAVIIGPEVFCYRHLRAEHDPNVMYFLMELYNRYQFFGFTGRKEHAKTVTTAQA